MSALRKIDYKGGLNNYISYTKSIVLGSEFADKLKEEMKQKFLELTGTKFNRYQILRDEKRIGKLRPSFSKTAKMSVEELNAWAAKIMPRKKSLYSRYGYLFPDTMDFSMRQKAEQDRLKKDAARGGSTTQETEQQSLEELD